MAFALTYDTLLEKCADYLERDDITLTYPMLIRLAEKKVSRILKNQLATLTVTDNLTLGSQLVTKPERWVENLSFTITAAGRIVTLKKRSRETIQAMYPSTTATGVPKYYSEWQENYFFIGPATDDTYAFELLYYQEPIPLDSGHQTNYLTENAPDLMIYSTLLEAEGYLKNDDRVPLWKAARDEILSDLGLLDARRQSDRQENRKKGA